LAAPCLFQTLIVLVFPLRWYEKYCILHKQQRINMVPMDL
jgi:hypothetical protein